MSEFDLVSKIMDGVHAVIHFTSVEYNSPIEFSHNSHNGFWEKLNEASKLLKDDDFREVLREHGDGNFLWLAAKLEGWFSIVKASVGSDIPKRWTSAEEDELWNFLTYFHWIRSSCRKRLSPTERRLHQVTFTAETGKVSIGERLFSLPVGTDEYYWFRHLFESPDYTTFSEASKKYPEIIERNVTRLKKKLAELPKDLVEVSENKVRGSRINPKYERMK